VLSTLLVSSGIGSFVVGWRIARTRNLRRLVVWTTAPLLLVLAIVALAAEPVVRNFSGASLPFRIVLAVLVLAPAGLFMGMQFPLGMEVTRRIPNAPRAWFWALNGSASVVASILAVVISTSLGIQRLMLTGAATYLVAALLLVVYERRAMASCRVSETGGS
jgi:hypothetical protein